MDNYIYRDRKMMKWMPFNALLEQGDHLSELLRGRTRIDMPVLSPDQEAELNYKLEVAYLFKNEIILRYYEDGSIHEVQGVIMRTDMMNKLVFIGKYTLSAYQIVDIEVL
jgi:hypothetical protein